MPDDLRALLDDYQDALAYTDRLWGDLSNHDVTWRPNEHSSAIGWHLGHQAAVAHFMIRNLTAAEPSPDAELEGIMDSATDEHDRGHLPDLRRLAAYRRRGIRAGPSPCRRHRARERRRSRPPALHRHQSPGRCDQPRVPARQMDRRGPHTPGARPAGRATLVSAHDR